MDGVVAIVALAVFIGVWWWLVKQLRKNGKGFLTRHLLGCTAAWMSGLLIVGAALSMGIIEAKPVEVAQTVQPSKPAVKYTIVKDEQRANGPRKVEAMLSRRLTDAELADVAKTIRDDSNAKAERTFIGFRVEGQTDKSYWANASFDPEYEGSLIGLSAADYEALTTLDLSAYTGQVGSWLRDGALGHVMVLYKKDGRFLIDSVFAGGGRNTESYSGKSLPDGGTRLEVPDNGFGEYYILKKDGFLEGWGENGKYMALPPFRT